jgi:hypothetical protein
MSTEGFGEVLSLQRTMGISGVLHDPLELGTEQAWWAVLEAYGSDVDFGLFPAAQHRGWCGWR